MPGIDSPEPAVADLFQAALLAHSGGQLGPAEGLYRRVLEAEPAHAQALLAWGLLCADQGRWTDAAQLLGMAVREHPASAEGHARLADVLIARGWEAEAIAHYEVALELRPELVEARHNLANALQRCGRHDEAIAHYRAALAVQPNFAEALNNLGNSLYALRRIEEALDCFAGAVAARSDYAEAQANWGNVLLNQNQAATAIEHFAAALQLEPELVEAHNNLAAALEVIGRPEEALTGYMAAAKLRPEDPQVLANAARALHGLHRQGEAIGYYRAALDRRPNSGELHNNLGIALQDLHRYEEARVHYLAALAIDPANIFARTNLGNVLLELHRLDGAERHFREALRIDPQNARAHQGLAVLLLTRGKAGEAASHGRAGFRSGVETRPYRGSGHPVNALVLYSALGGNLKTEDWLDSQTFASTTLVMEFVDPGEPLPDHDVLINGIGDVERGPAALAAAAALEARLSAAIVNRPAAVAATGRVENARRLAELPGVRPILTLAFPRAELAGEEGPARLQAAGFGWPLLVRSPGYHTGEHFHKVDHPAQLASAVASLPGDEVVSIEFVDVAAADGFARKYRVMTVDGRLYPLHLAVSPLWKVHYVTAGMAKRPEHRAEDEAFLADMPPALGDVAMRTLEQIGRMLELDYAGVDFSLDASGRLVVFEANATMVAPPPDADELWDYRRPAVAAVHAAVRAMLLQRAGSSAV